MADFPNVLDRVLRHHWDPSDHGYLGWTYDPTLVQSVSNFGVAGTVNLARLHLPAPATVTNLVMHVGTGGGTLTSGQCFAALFTAAGALVGVTADQAVAWATTGLKTMALAGGPFACTPGDHYVAFFFNGTTGPGMSRMGNIAATLYNANLAAADSRVATADTGRTTTMPSTLGAKTAANPYFWAALS